MLSADALTEILYSNCIMSFYHHMKSMQELSSVFTLQFDLPESIASN